MFDVCYHRQGSARLGISRTRHQCRRRYDDRPNRWGCCASTSARLIAFTASSPRAATRRTSFRRTPRLATSFARKMWTSSKTFATKVRRCFEAGALATGSKLEIRAAKKPYARHASRPWHRGHVSAQRRSAGPQIPRSGPTARPLAASTDMGNVSHAMPAIHPAIGIDSLPAVNHQPEFTAHCITPAADQAIFDGALAMAWTIVDWLPIPPHARACSCRLSDSPAQNEYT